MARPRITIITPNLNHGQFIERTICSVLDQAYEDLEYFVVDGGSTDDSVEVMRLYEDESVQTTATLCRTRSDAVNHAIKRATGQIIGILNSNDVYLPGALDAVANRMAAENGPAWLVGQAVRIDLFDQQIGTTEARRPTSLQSYLMRDSGFIPSSTSFWRAGKIAGPETFDTALLFAADYEHACRLMAAGIMPEVLSEPLVAMRDHVEPQTAVGTLLRGLEQITVAECYSAQVPLAGRYTLWRNIDRRRRIYALAQAELLAPASGRFLWHELLRHPWWLRDDAVRRTLLHGVAHPAESRPAA